MVVKVSVGQLAQNCGVTRVRFMSRKMAKSGGTRGDVAMPPAAHSCVVWVDSTTGPPIELTIRHDGSRPLRRDIGWHVVAQDPRRFEVQSLAHADKDDDVGGVERPRMQSATFAAGARAEDVAAPLCAQVDHHIQQESCGHAQLAEHEIVEDARP